MIDAYIKTLVMLILSWSVYGYCQEDRVLPILTGALVTVSLLTRLGSTEKQYRAFEQLPLSAVIIISFLAGMIWRNFVPIPQTANSPFPEFTAALQSGSIFAALLIWMRPFTKNNMYRLVFCAWLTVALSINVPFAGQMLLVFSSFCFVAIAVVISKTFTRPKNKKYMFAYARDFVIYSTVLIMFTAVLFLGISRSIVAMERAFFNTMNDYILPRNYTHFLRISSQLNLISPGASAFDRRLVMQATLPPEINGYLKMQVFADYNNGTWNEVKEIKKMPLPVMLPPGQATGQITMFTFFKDLVPAPGGITAIKAKSPYLRSTDQIIYTENQQNTRMLNFSLSPPKETTKLSDAEFQRYTALPPAIAPQLKEIAQSIVQDEVDVKAKADKIAKYFHDNFEYSLEVSFSADDKGLIKMLQEKRPAYCTYFASGLALLLRAEGIPARVAAGFLTTEIIDRKNNTYLVRVNNAHAWTEVYAPWTDHVTGKTILLWRRLDATPFSISEAVNKTSASFDLEAMFEKMWLGVLRINAQVENLDKNQLKLYLILALITVMAFINRQKIFSAISLWLKGQLRSKKVYDKTPDFLRTVYDRYERFIKEKYGEARLLSDTDMDVIARIKEKESTDSESVSRLEKFIKAFQAVRFGEKSSAGLQELLNQFPR